MSIFYTSAPETRNPGVIVGARIVARRKLERILYVEDDPDIQEIARLALEEVGGFNVEICSLGREALVKAPEFDPDLILLDVMMPDIDGVTTFQELKKDPRVAGKPILFLTAKVQAEEVKSYKALGALDVIFKPFDPMKISETIMNIWEKQYE